MKHMGLLHRKMFLSANQWLAFSRSCLLAPDLQINEWTLPTWGQGHGPLRIRVTLYADDAAFYNKLLPVRTVVVYVTRLDKTVTPAALWESSRSSGP